VKINGEIAAKPLISICVPVLNEEESLPFLIQRLNRVSDKLKESFDFEYVFTDNNSTDRTWETLQELSDNKNTIIRAYRFAKNVGFQKSILFNYKQARGNAVIQIDADLQDPPELIEQFLDFWLQGYKIVSGVRIDRKESKKMNYFRRFGYWFIDVTSEHPIKRNAGDFRLLDRSVVDALNELKSPKPYIRGVISRMGIAEKDVLYARDVRERGESKFGFMELVKLGFTGFSNHSNLPLRIASYVGFISLALSFLGLVYFIALKFYQPSLPRGFASLYVMILFGIGVNSILLSAIGSYIKKIYDLLSGEDPTIVTAKI
jgi:glycosyltransferase involved in cell wall biosynthesis